MKKIYLYFIFSFFLNNMLAQNCFRGITTNPNNTVWNNPPYTTPYKANTGTNKFDWRQLNFNVSLPYSTTYNTVSQMFSPFFLGSEYPYMSGIIAFPDNNGINNDFNPEDGWELIRKDFGYKADGTTNTNEALAGPYFILYNKYSGTLRVFGWLPSANGDFPTLNVRLSMPNKVTGLFAYYNQPAQSMDQPSAKIYASTPASFPLAPELPFFADFKVAYDPCTCNSASNLKVSFEKIQEMDVTMYGRLLATSTPIDYLVNTNTNTYAFSKYLTSVYDDKSDYTVKAGMMTYTNISQMISDYMSSADATTNSSFLKDGFGILGKALLAGSKTTATVPTAKETSEALEAASTVSDFFSSAISSSGTSLPSVIQGEMSLVGKIQNAADQHFDYPIANPGSLGSDNAPECCSSSPYYPMYNEVLGVFALLNTPQVSERYNYIATGSGIIPYTDKQMQLSVPLQYVFNPAAKINLANSRVYASFEIETYHGGNEKNLFRRYSNNGGATKYTTPIVPIESLPSLIFSLGIGERTTLIPSLSILLDLEFQDLNKNGLPNKALYVLTYPVIVTSSLGAKTISTYSEYLTIGTTNYSASQTISAWKDVTVTGNLTTTKGAVATFNTGGNSILTAGSSIGVGIALEGGNYPFPVNYALNPQSTIAVNSFCAGSIYKANSVATSAKNGNNQIDAKVNTQQEKTYETTAYPNPTQNKVSFQYYVEEPSNVRLSIQDLTGRTISVVVDGYQEAGAYDLPFETANLANGVYIYTLETSQGRESKRLVIAK